MVVAEEQPARIGPLIRRLEAQGKLAVGLVIQVQRYFRALHAIAVDPAGPAVAAKRTYGFGNRQNGMAAQAGRWSVPKLETALATLIETDLTLRSTSKAPAMAVLERALLRVALLNRERR